MNNNPFEGTPHPLVMVGIPAYKEQRNIKQLVTYAKRYTQLAVVANDASTDDTAKTAEENGAYVITHKINKVIGAHNCKVTGDTK